MKYYQGLVGAFLFSIALIANSSPGAWMPESKQIVSIIVEGGDGGQAIIIIDGDVPSEYVPADCNSGGNRAYNMIYLNTDKGRGMYSLALAAYMSGKPVKLAVSCAGSRPLITHIRL